MAKYTMSKDGRMRATMLLKFRYTREELPELNKMACEIGYEDLRTYLEVTFEDAVYRLVDRYEEKMSERDA